jgi:hypothetical protein
VIIGVIFSSGLESWHLDYSIQYIINNQHYTLLIIFIKLE